MIDIKTRNNWRGDTFWTKIGHVTVAGSGAAAIAKDATQPEAEKIIQSWHKIAVLRARPSQGVMVGYITRGMSHISYLNELIETEEELFGMRVGDDDVTFFLVPRDPKTDTQLELIEVVEQNNIRYTTLPLY